ncbi:hypothetical protein T12_8102 [Trichinella patagoniensis]|uniref:Uncharacterized protein n=1 Tax=Trichinella patagoniensis TaxID=990121 RepID=A0A0V0ZXT0_9BILA|nr:hypothetical protein T12_8102 [Trichinella patagoniensis]
MCFAQKEFNAHFISRISANLLQKSDSTLLFSINEWLMNNVHGCGYEEINLSMIIDFNTKHTQGKNTFHALGSEMKNAFVLKYFPFSIIKYFMLQAMLGLFAWWLHQQINNDGHDACCHQ